MLFIIERFSRWHEHTIALFGALATAAAAFVAVFVAVFAESYRRHRDKQTVAASFAAEIRLLIDLAEEQNLQKLYTDKKVEMVAVQARGGSFSPVPQESFVFEATVYEVCADQIGIFDKTTAIALVRLYNVLNGFRTASRTALGAGPQTLAGRISAIDFALKLMREETPRSDAVLAQLDAIATRSWLASRFKR